MSISIDVSVSPSPSLSPFQDARNRPHHRRTSPIPGANSAVLPSLERILFPSPSSLNRFSHPPPRRDPTPTQKFETLKAHDEHQAVADRDDDRERQERTRDPAREEMLHLQVAQPRLGVFHHDRRWGTHTRYQQSVRCMDRGWKVR